MGKNLRKVEWIKMPINLTYDKRVVEMIEKIGMKGLGVYLALINEIYRRKGRCITLSQVKSMKFKGVTQKTILEVIYNFNLFYVNYDKAVYSSIDFLNRTNDDMEKSDCNQIAIKLKSD